MKKTFVSLFLAILMILLPVVGCGKVEAPMESGSDESNSEAPTEETTEAPMEYDSDESNSIGASVGASVCTSVSSHAIIVNADASIRSARSRAVIFFMIFSFWDFYVV